MVKYHINKETHRANICKAEKKPCPLGPETPHFSTKELAQEELAKILEVTYGDGLSSVKKKNVAKSTKEVTYPSEPIEVDDLVEPADTMTLSAKEEALLKKQLRRDLYSKDYKKLMENGIDGMTEANCDFYGKNMEGGFSYDSHGTIKSFKRGACGALAYELHRKTGLPIVVFTLKSNHGTSHWSGHVALEVSDGKYLDVEGVVTRDEIDKDFSFQDDVVVETMGPKELLKLMQIEHEDIYGKLNPLPAAILQRISNDIAQDYRSGKVFN